MADNDGDKRSARGRAGGTAAKDQDADTAPAAPPPRRPVRVLSRAELEALRARLQKKFH
jgi:hypothetical protein